MNLIKLAGVIVIGLMTLVGVQQISRNNNWTVGGEPMPTEIAFDLNSQGADTQTPNCGSGGNWNGSTCIYPTQVPDIQIQTGNSTTTAQTSNGEGGVIYVPAGCLYYLQDELEEMEALVVHGLQFGQAFPYSHDLKNFYGITSEPVKGCTQVAHSVGGEDVFTETVFLDQGMNWGNQISEFVIVYGLNFDVMDLPNASTASNTTAQGAASTGTSNVMPNDLCGYKQANVIVAPSQQIVIPSCMNGLTVSIHYGIDEGTEYSYAESVQLKRRADFSQAHDGQTPFYVVGQATQLQTPDWQIGTYTLHTGDIISSGTKATTVHWGEDSWPD